MYTRYPWTEHIDHDAFGELDLSNSGGNSGAIGCMVQRITDLNNQELRLEQKLQSVREAREIAFLAMSRFVTSSASASS